MGTSPALTAGCSFHILGQRWGDEEVKPMHTHKLEVLWPIARQAIEAAFSRIRPSSTRSARSSTCW
jgi:hypothetical protein